MTSDVTQLLEWKSTDGNQRCLLIVDDKDVPRQDIKRKQIEVAEYNTDTDEWETTETVDFVEELRSFGIPQSLID